MISDQNLVATIHERGRVWQRHSMPRATAAEVASQLAVFLHKYHFDTACLRRQHIFRTDPIVKNVLQKEVAMKKISRPSFPPFLSLVQTVVSFEISKEILAILQSAEANNFDGIATSSIFICIFILQNAFLLAR
jgi:hypothetical protein